MIALIQRVSRAEVTVAGQVVGRIGHGLLALIGIEREDASGNADRLLERLLGYRVFSDENGRMNRSLQDSGGSLLLVPQFTLAADTRKGSRPSFSSAAEPQQAQHLFEYLVTRARAVHADVASGRFGADMSVSLVNEGPVTFRLEA
ncbi:MAG: D-tyrosyl-tRNA(Tyr) deacylase [Pseudazoarcus pumilus]|nr:D-tyrosyl-tRNA(Tyr) deacylase [Pseudazoarcus pumilus]